MAKKTASKGAKNKRKVSGARGKMGAGKGKHGGTDPRGVIGIVLLCLGLLVLVSQFIPSSGGFLTACTLIARGMGGMLCLLLPVILCVVGVMLVFFQKSNILARRIVCAVLVFLFVETMLQVFETPEVIGVIAADGTQPNFGNYLMRAYHSSSVNCSGGGLIGALLAYPMYCALDVWGSLVVLVFASIIMLMVVTGVSFGGVGIALSEWLDELRVTLAERREERAALQSQREEEELERESERAIERQKRKLEQERVRQEKEDKRRETEAQRQAAQSEPQDEDEPQPRPTPKKNTKKKPKLEVVRPQQEEPDVVLDTARSSRPSGQRPRQSTADRRRSTARGGNSLYIERSDEFTGEGQGRQSGFTMQEAENAFLYGMNAGQGEYAEHTPVQPTQEPVQSYAQYDTNGQQYAQYDANGQQYAGYDVNDQQQYAPQTPAQPDEDDEDEPDWRSNPDAAVPGAGASNVQVFDAPRRRERDRSQLGASLRGGSSFGQGTQPQGQDVLAQSRQLAQNNAGAQGGPQDDTIVQLRGTRLDGTPLVMPQKDTHAGPEAPKEEYAYPPMDLLDKTNKTIDPNLSAKIEEGSRKLLETLDSFGVQAKLTHVAHGPAITRYELQPAPGVKVSRIVNLVDDIALNMASDGVRIEAPIPGKPAVGIEIPNEKIEMVSLREVLESSEMQRETSPTAVALGKGISGAPVVADMAKMPHVLIAGATGSGKSVCINSIINSIIYRASPKEVRLILIDPKKVELSVYNGIPQLLVPVVTDAKKASAALSWAVVEMDHRYKRFESMGVRNIKGYNAAIGPDEEPMSKIIVIIDELADLMMVAPGEVEESICRLAQLARAAGIHLVVATQRPSVNVITGVIKANIPSRIAFAVSSQIDSRTILDASGAEKLLGKGDMLYAPQGAGKPTRVQGCFVSDDEVQRIVDYVKGRHSAEYNEDVIEEMNNAAEEDKPASGDAPASGEQVDEMLAKAIELAVEAGQVSISMLQRRLRVGYARAGRLVDEMTQRGITAEAEGPTKPRTVLISREEWKRMQENQE